MGNNAAFTRFEAAVIAVYNRGVLDKELLSDLMRPYEGVDIDHGGMEGTLANDGFDIEEIVIRTFGKTLPARPDLPPNHREWTAEQEALHGACQEVRVIAGGMGCSHQLFGHPLLPSFERQLPKLDAGGSNPLSRSMFSISYA